MGKKLIVLFGKSMAGTGRRLSLKISDMGVGDHIYGLNHNSRSYTDSVSRRLKVWTRENEFNLVRWGSRHPLVGYVNPSNELNTISSIDNSRRKDVMLAKLRDADIAVPEFITSRVVPTDWLREQGNDIIIMRPNSHHGGSGTRIARANKITSNNMLPRSDRDNKTILMKWVPSDTEYRAHMVNGSMVYLDQKIHDMEYYNEYIAEHTTLYFEIFYDVVSKIRAFDNGYRHSRRDPDRFTAWSELETLCNRASEAIGLKIAAIDVIRKEDGEFVVLETNSAPGLMETKLDLYSRIIMDWHVSNGGDSDV